VKNRKVKIIVLALVLTAGAAVYFALTRSSRTLVLTGVVTTDQIIVSPEIQGKLDQVYVLQGAKVTNGQLIASIKGRTQQADVAFYSSSEEESAAQVVQAEADLKFQDVQLSNQIAQAEAYLASAEAQAAQAAADLENARLMYERQETLRKSGAESQQSYDQARTSFEASKARTESFKKQALAAQSAVALAKSNAEQVAARRAAVNARIHQRTAVEAQKERAKVQLDYTKIYAPISGIVNTRVALPGEVVNPSQAVVTLIDPNNLWIRIDIEETYIDKIHLDDVLQVKFPSGATRDGKVIYRGVDADYATQRDVSRTKRDIKTFEVRVQCDNRDGALAVGMTAYVLFPSSK
jgi:HlyD family secretion protein